MVENTVSSASTSASSGISFGIADEEPIDGSEKVQTLTDTNFEQTVNKSAQPVLVDFWAEWCGPCRRLAPTIDELASDYDGRVVVGKMNVDENPATQMRFSIMGIPTLLLFKGGQIVEQVVGLADKAALKKLIDKHV